MKNQMLEQLKNPSNENGEKKKRRKSKKKKLIESN